MKTARRSFGEPYECKKDWGEKTFVQCGGEGLVFVTEGENYTTAFFEAFPRDPDCFLRGEGKDVTEAEEKCFEKLQKVLNCKGHEYESRGRKDDYGYCLHCPLSKSGVLTPAYNCIVCDEPCHGNKDKDDQQYCKKHYYELDVEQAIKLTGKKSGLLTDDSSIRFFNRNKVKLRLFQERGIPIHGKKFSEIDDYFRRFTMKVENDFMKINNIDAFILPMEYEKPILDKYEEILDIALKKLEEKGIKYR
jgi:hypothetical protein